MEEIFKNLNEKTHRINLNKMEDIAFSNRLYEDLVEKTDKRPYVPKVFVCGEYIGGARDTKKDFESGRLKKILDECEMDKLRR